MKFKTQSCPYGIFTQIQETSLGSGEEALRKLITPSNGSSVIARYIHVDRERLGIKYKHAFIITEMQNLDDDYSDETVLVSSNITLI